MNEDLTALAADAYVYGFPLVTNLREVRRFTRDGLGSLPPAPFNSFSHGTALAGPAERFVSVNNDTVYSLAQADLSAGPLLLSVPDTAGRYYVLQFVDAWTNNFAYVGYRATGTGAGSFLLAPPGGRGVSQDGIPVIRFPTAVATIVGRWAVNGEADLPAVRALQSALTLRPATDHPGRGLPEPDASVPEDVSFYEQMRVWMQAFPPSRRDLDYQARFAPLGLFRQDSPYADPDPALLSALREGL